MPPSWCLLSWLSGKENGIFISVSNEHRMSPRGKNTNVNKVLVIIIIRFWRLHILDQFSLPCQNEVNRKAWHAIIMIIVYYTCILKTLPLPCFSRMVGLSDDEGLVDDVEWLPGWERSELVGRGRTPPPAVAADNPANAGWWWWWSGSVAPAPPVAPVPPPPCPPPPPPPPIWPGHKCAAAAAAGHGNA